jgi:HEAT repeat protein
MLALVVDEAVAVQVVEQALNVDLMLGARLAGEVRSDFQEKTVGAIQKLDLPDRLSVELLGGTKSNLVKPILIKFLRHQDIFIVKNAALYIGDTGDELAIEILTERLEVLDENFFSQKEFGGPDKTGKIWTEHIKALANVAPQQAITFLKGKLLPAGRSSKIITWFTGGSRLFMQLAAEEVLPRLVDDLRQSTSQAQKDELLNLIELNKKECEKFLPDLINILKNEEDTNIQQRLTDLIIQFNLEAVVKASIWMMSQSNEEVRKKAITFIVEHKIQCLQELECLLADENEKPDVALSTAVALAGLGHDVATNVLGEVLLGHEFYRARAYAASALRGIKNEESIALLLQGLEDPDEYVRQAAAFSLAVLGKAESISVLMNCLNVGHRDVHIHAIRSLAKLGIEAPLWEKLQHKHFGWQTAAVELVKLGKKHALQALCETLIDLGGESLGEIIDLLAKSADENSVEWLLDTLESPTQYMDIAEPYFLNRISLVLNRLPNRLAAKSLYRLLRLQTTQNIEQISWLLPYTQNQCKFYNYEIFRSPPAKPQPTQQDTLDIIATTVVETNERIKQMEPKPKNDFTGATFSGPVNFGDNPTGQFIGTQNNYTTEPNIQATIDDLKTLITHLQNQHPNVTTEAQALKIIDAEFTEIKRNPTHKLATLRKQILNPERHLQAIKATAAEIVKHYLEESIWSKASITYIDKLSETPDQGA